MKGPELLSAYAKSLHSFTVMLPAPRTFPCVVVIGVRGNYSGRPRGIEADFLQFVATALEGFPAGDWPSVPFHVDSMRYDGERIIVGKGSQEYWATVDRRCPCTRLSASVPPEDFARTTDPEALAFYLQERPHTSTPLALSIQAARAEAARQKPVERRSRPRRKEAPLYERPSTSKTLLWLGAGVVLVLVGLRWLGLGMKQGIAVNFYGWGIVALGAVLIVRRSFDLFFPPSRL